jgi:hypothetical protein
MGHNYIHDCVAICRFDNHGFHLEIQFGSDSHEQLHIQIVVVRDKGFSGSTSSNHVHHGRFDLEESHVVEKSADVRDDLRANVKLLSHVCIDNEVQVTLPEAGFLCDEITRQSINFPTSIFMGMQNKKKKQSISGENRF